MFWLALGLHVFEVHLNTVSFLTYFYSKLVYNNLVFCINNVSSLERAELKGNNTAYHNLTIIDVYECFDAHTSCLCGAWSGYCNILPPLYPDKTASSCHMDVKSGEKRARFALIN